MRRILIGLLLVAPMAWGQGLPQSISDRSEELMAFNVPTQDPKQDEAWTKYWGKCGYKDVKGHWAIPPQFDWAGQFHEGYALVVVGAHVHKEDIRTKRLDYGGGKARELGVVLMFDNGHMAVIDKTGRVVTELPSPPGKLLIRIGWSSINNGIRWYDDLTPDFQKSDASVSYSLGEFGFHEGMAWIESPHGCVYLRKSGDSVTSAFPQSFLRCGDFWEGLAAVKLEVKNGKYTSWEWGFIAKDGQWAVPPQYEGVAHFSEGLAAVQPVGHHYQWGAIDKTGAMVIPIQFAESFVFSEGLAYVDQRPREYIDKHGQVVFSIEPFELNTRGYSFHNGLARYEVNNADYDNWKITEAVYLDRTGKVAFRFHTACQDFDEGVGYCWETEPYGKLFFNNSGNIVLKNGNTARMEKDLADSPAVANVQRSGATSSPGSKAIQDNQGKEADEDLKKLKEISDLLGQLSDKEVDDAVEAGLASLPRTKEEEETNIALYREALKVDPRNVKVHTDLANALQQKGDLDGAIQEFEETIRLEPGVADHYYSRGLCYVGKSQFDKALADYNKALELTPNYPNALGGRADTFFYTHEYRKAIADYTAFLKAVPNSALAYTRRGTSYYSLQDYHKAIADYEKAVELDPKQLEAINNLAWMLATAPVDGVRNGAKAVEVGQKALALADKSQSFLYMDTLAAAYAEAGRFADAVALQTKAVSLIPKDYYAKGAAEMRNRLQLYKTNKPCRDNP